MAKLQDLSHEIMVYGLPAGCRTAFAKLVAKVFHDDLALVQDYADLLLLEVAKHYRHPGGLWELQKELLRFDEEHRSKMVQEKVWRRPAPRKEGRLKILVVSGMFPCLEHGGGLRLFDIIRALATEHEVDIFSVFEEKLDRLSLELLQERLHAVKLVSDAEMRFEHLQQWLAELGKEFGDYDVVQFEYPHAIHFLPQVKKFGVRTGYTFMECQTKSLAIYLFNLIKESRFDEIPRLVERFWHQLVLEKMAVDHADFLVTVTRGDARAVEELGPVRSHVIPTCISNYAILDKIEANAGIVAEEQTVVFVGYYDHYPNLDGMVWYLKEVHPMVKAHLPGYKIYVVGRGNVSSLQALSQDDPSVVYTGRVECVVPHILRAKAAILPLINGAGIRGKLNQYAVAGRPSVSTTIGNHGLPYVDEESVLVANDPGKFAHDLIRLLTDQELYERLQRNSQQLAREHFTWPNHLARLVELYRGGA